MKGTDLTEKKFYFHFKFSSKLANRQAVGVKVERYDLAAATQESERHVQDGKFHGCGRGLGDDGEVGTEYLRIRTAPSKREETFQGKQAHVG